MKKLLYGAATAAAASVLCCGELTAQTDTTSTIDRSVDVVNAYQPTLRRARKISVAPLMDDTATYSDKFKYQLLNRVATVTTKPDSLTAASMEFPAYKSPYRAVVEGGVGSLPSFFGQIIYTAGSSKEHHLSMRAGHLAQLGKVKLSDGSKVDAPQNETWAGLNYDHFGGNVRSGFNVNFKNLAYKYYGRHTVSDSVTYVDENGVLISGADLLGDSKQRNTTLDVDFCIGNAMADPLRKFTFGAKAALGIFGNKSGVHQTDIKFGGALRFPIKGGAGIDADLAVNVFKVHKGDEAPKFDFVEHSGTDIRVFPHFIMDYDYMSLRLGLRVIGAIGDDYSEKDDFIVQPDLNADFFMGDGSVRLYAALTGDYGANSYRSLVERNLYVMPDGRKYIWDGKNKSYVTRYDIKPSQSPIVFKLGARAAFCKEVQLHVGIEYNSLGDEVFFLNRHLTMAYDSTTVAFAPQFAILQDDGKLFRFHGEINVTPTPNSNILFEATYSKYNMNNLEEAWYRPACELSLSGRFKPTDRLLLRARLSYEGKRKAYDPSRDTASDLDGFIDLNIGAHYYISNRWTAFLDVNNIAAADQQRWFGYSSYRFNAMAGFTYKF